MVALIESGREFPAVARGAGEAADGAPFPLPAGGKAEADHAGLRRFLRDARPAAGFLELLQRHRLHPARHLDFGGPAAFGDLQFQQLPRGRRGHDKQEGHQGGKGDPDDPAGWVCAHG